MFILDDEELRLRHELAHYRCLLDGDTDDVTDQRLRDAIAQTKARLHQLDASRIGEIAAFCRARGDRQSRARRALARLKSVGHRASHG